MHELQTVDRAGAGVGLPTELKTEHGTEAVERLQPAGALEGSAGGSALQRPQEEELDEGRGGQRVDPLRPSGRADQA